MQPFKIGDINQYYSAMFYSEGKPLVGQVLTLKDYEDQIAALSQENFNLKMKIYILDERLFRQADRFKDLEDLEKKNEELKEQLANLQKEIDEKNDLLRYAGLALDMMEKIMRERELILSLKLSYLKEGVSRFKLDEDKVNYNEIVQFNM